MPKVSIAMATYNGAKYLKAQLDSFVTQTRLPDELVVCDDVSNDETWVILEEFQAIAPFHVRLHRNEQNLGFIKNFEKALSLCQGDIIFLSDQDDVWFDNKVNTIVDFLDENQNLLAVTNDQIITDEYLAPSGTTKLLNLKAAGLPMQSMITGCCTAIRKELRDFALPIYEECKSHDDWIGCIADVMNSREIISTPLQFYRRHGKNASSWVMSSLQKPSRLSELKLYGFKDARNGWALESRILENIECRLQNSQSALVRRIGSHLIFEALIYIKGKRVALTDRTNLVSSHKSVRWIQVVKLWSSGGYRFFQGAQSALKDIIR